MAPGTAPEGVTDRRSFVRELAAAGVVTALPWGSSSVEGQQRQAQLRLGPGAAILDVPENRAVLSRIEQARELTPEQLLSAATFYRDNPATAALAYRLAASAMAMVVSSRNVDKAMGSIARAEVEWSFWGDVWNKIKNFFTGGTDQKDPAHCKYKCVGLLVISALLEKCGDNDDWHIIGVCSGFSW